MAAFVGEAKNYAQGDGIGMIDLRPYQVRTLDQAWDAMQYQHNVLIVAPCAAGKTIMFAKIVQRLLRENPTFRALILVDREILVTQSRDKLFSVAPELGGDIGIVCSSVTADKDHSKRVTIASRQTLVNQLDRFEPVQLTIIDECHLMAVPKTSDIEPPDQFAKIISALREYNPNMRLLGCTASPYRLGTGYIFGGNNKEESNPYFQQIDAEITTKELLYGGFIAPLTGRVSTGEGFTDDLKSVAITGGEYNLGQLSDLMCKETHVQSCVDAWKQYASDRKKTLVFCTTIKHSETVAKAFSTQGIPAYAIHSKLSPIEETARMAALENGTAKVFTSVAKLTTGMDVIDLDCGIMARPTKSTALYKQMVGRFQRIAPGKIDALIIDLVGATKEFGTDMDNLKVTVPRGGDGEAPFKICPGDMPDGTVCGQSVHASLQYCPHCSYEFPRNEAVEAKLGKLNKVDFNKMPDPEEYTVTHVEYHPHESRNTGKKLIKVEYQCGINLRFNEWVCLPDFYEGYAVSKARDWWEDRSDEPFPDSVDEFMFLADSLIQPASVVVVQDGKYYRVKKCKFEKWPGGDDEFVMADRVVEGDEVPF